LRIPITLIIAYVLVYNYIEDRIFLLRPRKNIVPVSKARLKYENKYDPY